MKLTENQIQKLYKFTQQHYVEWYDLQTELVDHMANDIEDIWNKEPNLSFDQAKDKSFKKFGVCGFSDVISEKTKALQKQYRKLIWKHLIEYFKLPKIALTLLLILLLCLFIHKIENKHFVLIPTLLGMLFITFYFTFNLIEKIKIQQKNTKKKWLIERSFLGLGNILQILLAMVNLGLQFNLVLNTKESWGSASEIFLASFIIIFSIILFIAIKIIPKKLAAELSKQYPEYNFVTI